MLHRRAFSLIELLVCIAIIALLTGLLLPVLHLARESGRSAVCVSNLHQLSLALESYAGDNKGHLAPGAPQFQSNLVRWHGSRANAGQAFAPGGGSLSPYLDSGSPAATTAASSSELRRTVRTCPTFATITADLATRKIGFERSCGGYGYNNTYAGQMRANVGEGGLRVTVLVSDRSGSAQTRFARPAETIAFADAALSADPTANAQGLIEYSFIEPRFRADLPMDENSRLDPSMHFRHSAKNTSLERGTAAAAMLDGHVSHSRRGFYWRSGVYLQSTEEPSLGWSGTTDDNGMYDYAGPRTGP